MTILHTRTARSVRAKVVRIFAPKDQNRCDCGAVLPHGVKSCDEVWDGRERPL